MQRPRITRFYNAHVLHNHEFAPGELWCAEGKIIAPQEKADESIDAKGLLLAPGYIDLQINGAFGVDFSTHPEKIQEVANRLPQYGVTAFLPTLISTSPERYHTLIPSLQAAMGKCEGASILGIHLEGPFLQVPAAHDAASLKQELTYSSLQECYGSIKGVKLITLAPELTGAFPVIQQLVKQGIVVAAGHSLATYEEMREATKQGVTFVTHLYNAMSPFHQRAPGIIGATLTHEILYFSLIVDGLHVHPAAVKMAWNCHAKGMILVSDANAALGMAPGRYTLGTRQIDVTRQQACLVGTNTLAGSTLSLDAAVRNLRTMIGCSHAEAVETASIKPAKLLNLSNKGHLGIGADADLILLDDGLYVQACYIAGKRYYKGPGHT